MWHTVDNQENMCDSCENAYGFPMCICDDVEFGEGRGGDNIVACSNYRSDTPSGTIKK